MKSISLALCLVFLFSTPLAAQDWKPKGRKLGVTGHSRNENGKFQVKLVTSIATPLSAIVAAFMNPADYKNWMHGCISSEMIELNENDHYLRYYAVSDLPWPVADRDIIMYGAFYQDPSSQLIHITGRCQPNFLPKKPPYERMKTYDIDITLIPVGAQETQIEFVIGLKGDDGIPIWVIDLFASDKFFTSIAAFRKLCESEKYKNKNIKGVVNK